MVFFFSEKSCILQRATVGGISGDAVQPCTSENADGGCQIAGSRCKAVKRFLVAFFYPMLIIISLTAVLLVSIGILDLVVRTTHLERQRIFSIFGMTAETADK